MQRTLKLKFKVRGEIELSCLELSSNTTSQPTTMQNGDLKNKRGQARE
ncbi:MAG: hypothetical protein QXL78_05945 [Methanocellales archaeon]